MPKDGRRGKKRLGLLSLSDLTLHDFADCPRPQSCARVKKSIARAAVNGAVPETSDVHAALEEDELNWFDKDLDSFVIPEADKQNEDALVKSKTVKDEKKHVSNKFEGSVYPYDLWFSISNYLVPEAVATFSRICKAAHSITLTASFWRRLYERLEGSKHVLPDHLKPHSMERLHGLKARVVCSFFHLYPPLAARVQRKGPMEDEPHCLKGHRCLLAWHQPAPKGWQFCFKFQKPSLQTLMRSRASCKLDVYRGYNDLLYNPEEGCSVLQVTCCHFAAVAAVMGLLLNQVYVTLSTGFRHHRLRLHFDSSLSQNVSDTVVILDDVISIKLMQWWHPGYPFTT